MNGTSDIGKAEMYGDEGGLDPREAARLLAQTQRQAQRALDFRSPWLSLLAAAAALVAFGSVWLSVRGQHPYKWPTPWVCWACTPSWRSGSPAWCSPIAAPRLA